jgi:glycosyltransferase involved in cell wall biosynthesis
MPALSAVIITQDNEQTVADTLAALTWCDELLVVDSGSVDRTVAICREFGCRVLQHTFTGFGPQKNLAVSAAANDWVLVIDSDEIVTAALRDEIVQRLASDAQRFAGFEIPVRLLFLGRVLRFGGEFDKRHLRLFDRRKGNYNLADIHERVILDGPVAPLAGHILHASYRDFEHYFDKFNRYTSSVARQLDKQAGSVSKWYIAWRFPASFCYLYVLRGLVFDGYPGFVWAMLSAFYSTVKYMKLLELRDSKRKRPP